LTVVFHPLAERELIESAKFYETRAAGLGVDFIRQVERTLAAVATNPGAGSVLTGTIRRKLVQRFPFALLYQQGPDGLSALL
jgi:plasmid stabilization system protein ParE